MGIDQKTRDKAVHESSLLKGQESYENDMSGFCSICYEGIIWRKNTSGSCFVALLEGWGGLGAFKALKFAVEAVSKFHPMSSKNTVHKKPPRRRVGRPTKYTAKVREAICEAIADGTPYSHAAALGGISYETFCEWRREKPEFSDAINKAVAKGIHSRLKLILESAKKGNVKAATWWLEHVLPEHFARSSVSHKHQVEGEVKQTWAISPETLNALVEARRRYDGSSG